MCNIFYFHILSFYGFQTCVDFTRIAASNTASDTSPIRSHIIFNINFLYYYAHFVVELMKNIALMAAFNTI